MNPLPKNHREYSKNHNFLMESRFVFWGSPEASNGNDAVKQAASNQPQTTSSTPFTATKWEDHQKHFDAHLTVFKAHGNNEGKSETKNDTFIKQKKEEFKEKLTALEKQYKTELKSAQQGSRTVTHEHHETAAKAVEGGVSKLLTDIKIHIHVKHHDKVHNEVREKIQDEATGILKTAGIKPADVKKIYFTYKDLVKANLAAFKPGGTKPHFIKLKNPPVYVQLNKPVDAKKATSIMDSKIPDAAEQQKVIKEIEGETANEGKEQTKESAKLSPDQAQKVFDMLKTALSGVEKAGMKKVLASLGLNELGQKAMIATLSTIDLTKSKVTEVTVVQNAIKNLKFTPQEITDLANEKPSVLKKVVMILALNEFNKTTETVNKYSKEKGEMIHDLLTNDALTLKKGLSIDAADAIDDLFDRDADPLRRYLVMKHTIDKDAKDNTLLINGEKITEVSQLTKFLPPGKAQTNFKELLKLEKKSSDEQKAKKDELEKSLSEEGQTHVTMLENMEKLKPMLKQYAARLTGSGAETAGTGSNNPIANFFKMLSILLKAWKDQDFDTFGEAIDTLFNGGGPEAMSSNIKKAETAYKQVLANLKPADTSLLQLFDAQDDPTGKAADDIFFKDVPQQDRQKHPLNQYRTKFVKPMITDYLQDQLNLSEISSIKTNDEGVRTISGKNHKGASVTINIKFDGGKSHAKIEGTDTAYTKVTLAELGQKLGKVEGKEGEKSLTQQVDDLKLSDLKGFTKAMKPLGYNKAFRTKYKKANKEKLGGKMTKAQRVLAYRKAFLKANLTNDKVKQYIQSKTATTASRVAGGTPAAPGRRRKSRRAKKPKTRTITLPRQTIEGKIPSAPPKPRPAPKPQPPEPREMPIVGRNL